MLRSISYMPSEVSPKLHYDVFTTVQSLKYYFQKFNQYGNTDEVMQKAYEHALYHFSPEKGNLTPYIKKLAMTLSKNKEKYQSVDFIDNVLATKTEDGSVEAISFAECDKLEQMIDSELSDNLNQDLIELSLEYMNEFVSLSQAVRDGNTSYQALRPQFKHMVNKLKARYAYHPNFIAALTSLYLEHEEDFDWFIGLEDSSQDIGIWREVAHKELQTTPSRIKLIGLDEVEVVDADTEDFVLKGNLNPSLKRVLKVDYEDVWEFMCDKLDSEETNECKFILGNNYLIRTYGNSVIEELNVDLYKIYDLVREEIATNLIKDLGGRLLNLGSRNVYILSSVRDTYEIPKRTIKGYDIVFNIEDITEELLSEQNKG